MRQVRSKAAPKELDRLRRELVTLDDDIAKARRRVVEVDTDMLSIVQDHLRKLRERHSDAVALVRSLESFSGATETSIEATVERAMEAASTLDRRLAAADSFLLREALSETVEGIDLRFTGRPSGSIMRWDFTSGTIRLAGSFPVQPVQFDTMSSTAGGRNGCW